jgi:hypothetical protein
VKISINYPVNGCDLDLFIEGDIDGISREEHELDLYHVRAKYKGVEVFKFDGEEHGLLKDTMTSDDILTISKSMLVEFKFSEDANI